ncbi:hypothetical protein ACFSJW_24160 [Flavobacterium artemisiae]|uniref:6-bladed beta-propeller protein n=1 Tax=Flavobacterium artemisiae TaxID=2126556 RepID=A0ABW4H9C8_9FLAO
MKKLFFICLLFCKSISFSQTILNSFPLNLNEPSFSQLLNVQDVKTKDVYVFASDNKDIKILKYNQSLFLTQQFTDSIKFAKDRNLIGYSIGEDQSPLLYWSTKNYNNLRIIKYNLNSKTTKSLNFDFPSNHDYIVTTFQKENVFYILAKEKQQPHLLLYKFENGNCEIKMFDFSAFAFQNGAGKNFSFSLLILRYPIQKADTDSYNPLDKTAAINKMYVVDNHIILTLDYSPKKTQVFDLNIETAEIKEKTFNLPVSTTAIKAANSFYSDKKLFQIAANKDVFLFDVKDYESGETIKSLSVTKNDSITFKNSPFFLQMNDNKPQELKTTAKFLKSLSDLGAGISVLKSRKNSFITFGGFVEFRDYYYGAYADDILAAAPIEYSQSKMVYFESLFDENFNFVKSRQSEPLALDNLFYFLSISKNIALQNILKLDDYYILTYYDTSSKQLFIRRFTDGYINLDPGNPIMNKSLFSQPFSFEKIKSR